MKGRKFTFYLGIVIFMIAGCGIDNGGWWMVACLAGLGLSFISIAGCTKREKAYILSSGKKIKDFKF